MINSGIHSVHPYPCKYPASAVRPLLCGGGGVLLDPFCGSGTTLLEGALNGWNSVIGFDNNPIAVLISRFKMLQPGAGFWKSADSILAEMALTLRQGVTHQGLSLHSFDGRDHWFTSAVQDDLAAILSYVRRKGNEEIRLWLEVSLSRIVNTVSRQASETRYVAIDKAIGEGHTIDAYVRSCFLTLQSLKKRSDLHCKTRIELADATNVPLDSDSVDRIVTSPPYANTMDYYLYHKQRMNVLALDFRSAQRSEIGSRWEYSSLRAPLQKWYEDYSKALSEMYRCLRGGGDAFVIIGDSQIAGEKVDAAHVTFELAREIGFTSEIISSIPLDGKSKSFQKSFQRPNKREHTLRLAKESKSLTGRTRLSHRNKRKPEMTAEA